MYGIYIHFPYCVHKCSYCDFYSIENLNSRNKFVECLCNEIELRANNLGSKIQADTLFFGGGTPSLMKPHHIEKIFRTLDKFVDFTPTAEMTMECNPGTIDIKHFNVYKGIGINRISFGVQSFIERDLKFLERIHTSGDVGIAVDTARKAGFENISIDLIFALPGQSADDWKYNLNKAVELDTEHISAYSLIYEPGTPLYEEYISGKIEPQDEEKDSDLYEITDRILSNAGFNQYEISNYSKDGYKCKHNLKYWDSGEYIGLGPSAHGYLDGQRYWNYRSNQKYFSMLDYNKLPTEGSEVLTEKQKAFEYIYLGLRAEGLQIIKFCDNFGIDIFDTNKEIITKMELMGYLTYNNNLIKLTNKGYFISDDITIKLASCLD